MKTKNIITIIIMLIILALFLLAGIIAPRLFRQTICTRYDTAIAKMAPIKATINAYKLNTGKLPYKLEDLCICPAGLEGSWNGPYLKANQLNDPWDRPYLYKQKTDNSNSYEIISYGADGLPGGEENNADIYNGYRK